jgi:predicted aconitase with swiveling domain
MNRRTARVLAPGEADGTALVLSEPLSFWGGVDIATGRIVDRLHPEAGRSVRGTVLVMPSGRGSSSSSAVLAEMMRIGTAPAAIVLGSPDPILTVGAIVAESLYGARCPIVVCALDGLLTGMRVRVTASDESGLLAQSTPRSRGR